MGSLINFVHAPVSDFYPEKRNAVVEGKRFCLQFFGLQLANAGPIRKG
jgi:hypothetical protein